MANIDITLLTSKRTYIEVDGLGSTVATQAGGYIVVAGEGNATKFSVHYPSTYAGYAAFVYMKNSAGDYKTHHFGTLSTTDVEFLLPAEMTLEGNTSLVFYAVTGSGENKVTAIWAPVIVPVTSTGVDYKKVAVASPDVLEEVISEAAEALNIANGVAAAAENGDFDGKSVFIRFSASSNGASMTSTWQEGQDYIGVYLGTEVSALPADYIWSRFVGGSQCVVDNSTTNISHTALHNLDASFKANDITNIAITIPADVAHGYFSGVNFKTGSTPPTFSISTTSALPLKLHQYGFEIDGNTFAPAANSMVEIIIRCNGFAINAFINEDTV